MHHLFHLIQAKKRWNNKIYNQQMQIIHEDFLHKQIAIKKEHFIKKYETKMRYLQTNIEGKNTIILFYKF